jgi:hypothetical protein
MSGYLSASWVRSADIASFFEKIGVRPQDFRLQLG